MINLDLYRARIGLHRQPNSRRTRQNFRNRNSMLLEMLREGILQFTEKGIKVSAGNVFCCFLFFFIYYVSMVYIMSLIMALCIEISLNQTSCRSYPMEFSFNIPASEISPTILIILLIFHLLKTTKNTNPLNQIKTVFCLNTKNTSIFSIVELLNTHIGLHFLTFSLLLYAYLPKRKILSVAGCNPLS